MCVHPTMLAGMCATGVGCHVQITTERACCQSVRDEAMGIRLSPDPNGNCLGQRACTGCNHSSEAIPSSEVQD